MVGCCYFAPVTSRVSPRRASYFFLLRQKKVTKKKASHVRAASRSLALLAAFGTLANSLRSNSASVLIRTLLRCSARPNGGGYLSARPLRELRPNGLFAALTSRGLGFPHFSRLTSLKARHAVPLQITPHPSPLTPHPSPLTPHPSPLTPHSSPLTPHPSPLTPHPSFLTPHPSPLIPHSSLLTPHSSLLTPHSSPARAKPLRVFSRSGAWPLLGAGSRLAGVCVGRQRGFLPAGRQLAGWKPWPAGVPRNG